MVENAFSEIKREPTYSQVELEDAGTDLLSGEKVILHKEIIKYVVKSYPAISCDYDYQIDKATKLFIDPIKITSPPDFTSIVLNRSKTFELLLLSAANSEAKVAWEKFSSSGIIIKEKGFSVNRNESGSLIKQFYDVELKKDCNLGYLQFYSVADGVKYHDMELQKYGSLMTFCFFAHLNLHTKFPYPTIYPVVPTVRQTFAPLLVGQTLQIIVSLGTKITYSNSLTSALKYSGESNNGMYKYANFLCQRQIEQSESIYIQSTDSLGKSKTSVVIVPPLDNIDGKFYPMLPNPVDTFVLYCYNIAGFILLTDKIGLSTPRDYLDTTKKLKVLDHSYKNQTQKITVGFKDKSNPWIKVKNLYSTDCDVK